MGYFLVSKLRRTISQKSNGFDKFNTPNPRRTNPFAKNAPPKTPLDDTLVDSLDEVNQQPIY